MTYRVNQRTHHLLRTGLLLLVFFGCSGTPAGPPFEWAKPPPEHRGRVYLYRADTRSSLASVHATIDGREIGSFRDGEYETLELPAGGHRLRAGMRGLAFFSIGRNQHRFDLKPGEIVYLRLEVRLAAVGENPLGGPSELEIGGRSDQRGAENVFISTRTREQAEPDLKVSTRVSPAD